ncbi:hypothetical protein [Nostoc sp.]
MNLYLGGFYERYIIIDTEAADNNESESVIESVKAASVEFYASECQA